MRSCDHAHACAGEFGAQLVVPPCADALLRAIDVECGNGRVVGGLFGEVRHGDSLAIAGYAVRAAGGSRVRCLQGGMCIFNLPVALQTSVLLYDAFCNTHPEELAQRRIVGLAWLSLDIFLCNSQSCLVHRDMSAYQVLCEPEAQASQQAAEIVVGVADADECVWPIQVVPVLCCPSGHVPCSVSCSQCVRRTQVWPRLEKLRREGEAHGSEIGDTNEPARG